MNVIAVFFFALIVVSIFGGMIAFVRAIVAQTNRPTAGLAADRIGGRMASCNREGCGQFNPLGAEFCRRCGAVLAERSVA